MQRFFVTLALAGLCSLPSALAGDNFGGRGPNKCTLEVKSSGNAKPPGCEAPRATATITCTDHIPEDVTASFWFYGGGDLFDHKQKTLFGDKVPFQPEGGCHWDDKHGIVPDFPGGPVKASCEADLPDQLRLSRGAYKVKVETSESKHGTCAPVSAGCPFEVDVLCFLLHGHPKPTRSPHPTYPHKTTAAATTTASSKTMPAVTTPSKTTTAAATTTASSKTTAAVTTPSKTTTAAATTTASSKTTAAATTTAAKTTTPVVTTPSKITTAAATTTPTTTIPPCGGPLRVLNFDDGGMVADTPQPADGSAQPFRTNGAGGASFFYNGTQWNADAGANLTSKGYRYPGTSIRNLGFSNPQATSVSNFAAVAGQSNQVMVQVQFPYLARLLTVYVGVPAGDSSAEISVFGCFDRVLRTTYQPSGGREGVELGFGDCTTNSIIFSAAPTQAPFVLTLDNLKFCRAEPEE